MSVEYPGPFPAHCDLVVDGYSVPFIQAHEMDGGQICFILDKRLAFNFPVAVADQVARFVADAIAVTSGIGAHPRAEYDHEQMLAQLRQSPLHPSLLPHRVHEITAAAVDEPPESPS